MLHPLIMGFAFVVYSTPSVMLAEDLPYLEEFRHGQPELGTNESWEMNHVPVQVDSLLTTHRASIRQDNFEEGSAASIRGDKDRSGVELYLCLFGVPGVHRGKANDSVKPKKAKTNTAAWAVEQTAQNQVSRVVIPAESRGADVFVFAHGWVANNDDVSSSSSMRNSETGSVANSSWSEELREIMQRSYGGRLVASQFEPFMHAHHLVSMVYRACINHHFSWHRQCGLSITTMMLSKNILLIRLFSARLLVLLQFRQCLRYLGVLNENCTCDGREVASRF